MTGRWCQVREVGSLQPGPWRSGWQGGTVGGRGAMLAMLRRLGEGEGEGVAWTKAGDQRPMAAGMDPASLAKNQDVRRLLGQYCGRAGQVPWQVSEATRLKAPA